MENLIHKIPVRERRSVPCREQQPLPVPSPVIPEIRPEMISELDEIANWRNTFSVFGAFTGSFARNNHLSF